jgi:serine/threonine protein kinase/HEAT repeat protein
MATDPIATVLSRRCARCGALHPLDQEHLCPGSAGAATIETPAPAATPAMAEPPAAQLAVTVEQPAAQLAVTVEQPASQLAVTVEQPAPRASTQPLAGQLPDTAPLPLAIGEPQLAATQPAGPGPAAAAPRRPGVPVDLVGLVLGERYEIKERLSAGGMGVVYKARHIVLESPVAVKVLLRPQDSTAQKRFLQEAKVASAIRHPHTVYISDFGVLSDGRSYLVMEFLQGPTLARVLRGGPLDPVRACRIALQITQGLQAVHARGIVHRDLKPDNIFLIDHSQHSAGRAVGPEGTGGADGPEGRPRREGQKDFVKIVDFGIAVAARGSAAVTAVNAVVAARPGSPAAADAAPASPPAGTADERLSTELPDLSARHTQDGVVLGTPHYMSPEQADDKEIDQRTDQYALGCILFEMLTGKVPYDHPTSTTNILVQHMSAPIPSPRKVHPAGKIPEAIEALVMRMMAKQPEQRYRSLDEVAAVLVGELAVMAPEEVPTAQLQGLAGGVLGRASITTQVMLRPRRWQLLAALLGVLGLLLAVGVLGVQKWQQGRGGVVSVPSQVVDELRGRAVAVLKEQLQAPEPAVRQQAVEGLGKARDVSQRSAIEPLLADREPQVQAQAADALGQLGDRAATPALKELLGRSGEASVRAAAAAALDVLGDDEGPRQLRQMLDGRDEQGRFRAAYLLCEKGDRKAAAVLSEFLEHKAPPDEVAVDILTRLAQAGEGSARKQLAVRLSSADKPQRRLLVARRLAQIGDERGHDALAELAGRPGPDQLLAARLLASPEEPVGAPLFRRVLAAGSATEPEQQLAIEGLGLGGQLADLLLLRPRLEPQVAARLRRAAATAVLQLAAAAPGVMSEQSLAWAQGALRDGNWLVRQSAVAVLGDAPGDRATQLLLPLLKDPDVRVRRGTVKALWRRPATREVLASLRVMLFDPDSGVREETLQTLLRVGRALQKQGMRDLPAELAGWLKDTLAAASPREQLLARTVLYKLGDESQRAPLHGFQTSADRELRRLYVREHDGDPDALTQALTDEDPAVRLLAASRLAERGDGRGGDILREALRRGGADGLAAYGLLRKLGQPAELPGDVTELLTSPRVEARLEAVEALGKLPVEVAAALLQEAARDPERLVRRLVAEVAADLPALPASGKEPGLPGGAAILRHLQQDPDAGIRFRATVLLLRFGTLPPPGPALLKPELRREHPLVRPTPPPAADSPPDAGAPPPAAADGGPTRPDASPEPAPAPAAAPAAGATALLLVEPVGAAFQLDGKGWLVAGKQPVSLAAGPHHLESLGGKQEFSATAGQTVTLRLPESPIEKLAHAGLEAFARKDYTTALKQMDKAARDCEKKRKYDLACAAISTELPLHIGQIYEQRGDAAEAMSEYEKAQKAGRRLKGRGDLLAAVEQARSQLGKKLGAVVRPKGSGAACKEITTWLEPGGPYTFTVDGKSQVVSVRAGETIQLGECH